MTVIWKYIPVYNCLYKISNKSDILNVKRNKLIKGHKEISGYIKITLSKNKIQRSFRLHQLVAMAFLGHIPNKFNSLIVDHIDDDKSNNKADNLQLITQRANSIKQSLKTSIYPGASFDKSTNKWMAKCKIKKKSITIGRYNTSEEASNAYINYIKTNQL